MLQILVNAHIYHVDQPPCGRHIKRLVEDEEGIPFELLNLSINGFDLSDDDVVTDTNCVIRATVSNGICGGKGGFGAMLRSLAKQKGKTKTTDFGACRDLSGRRLRHINDEIILSKWKEAKDRGEQFDTEEETATGIDLWYLSAPSWAEGIKVDKRRKFMKPRMKTSLCIDWLRARETKAPPAGAPLHWGCPRGARCEFAHGEDDLQGEARVVLEKERDQAKKDAISKKHDDYLEVVSRATKDDEEVNELVLEGLRKVKKAKLNDGTKNKYMAVGKDVMKPNDAFVENVATNNNLLQSFKPGDVDVNPVAFVVTGVSSFGTVTAPHCQIRDGTWYFEVELQSDGLMQIGWISSGFSSGKSEAGDGVGDCVHSWAFDGYRQKVWHNGVETDCGPQTGQIWRVGDVVGCYISLNRETAVGSIFFSVNGTIYDSKFHFALTAANEYFCPALSLESGERVAVNLGQETFIFFEPTQQIQRQVSTKSSSKGSLTMMTVDENISGRAVWRAIDPVVLVANGFAPLVEDVNVVGEDKNVKITDTSDNLQNVDGAANTHIISNSSSSAVCIDSVKATESTSTSIAVVDIDLQSGDYEDVNALVALGLPQLKHELSKRGLKCGGTAMERALRLHAFRNTKPGDVADQILFVK